MGHACSYVGYVNDFLLAVNPFVDSKMRGISIGLSHQGKESDLCSYDNKYIDSHNRHYG
jgi:hypothetical protein